MKEEYDFAKKKSRKNPYFKRLKKKDVLFYRFIRFVRKLFKL